MLEDDFYCTIKFKGGDEIFAKVAAEEDDDKTMLLISNPIVVEEVKVRGTVVGHKFEPWLKSSKDDMFLVNMDDVLTISESKDLETIAMHETFSRQYDEFNQERKLNRKMGYISTISEAKKSLEKLYNKS